MRILSTILLYGIPASLLLSVLIFVMGRINPRLMLRSYPKDVQAAVPPQTPTEVSSQYLGARQTDHLVEAMVS